MTVASLGSTAQQVEKYSVIDPPPRSKGRKGQSPTVAASNKNAVVVTVVDPASADTMKARLANSPMNRADKTFVCSRGRLAIHGGWSHLPEK